MFDFLKKLKKFRRPSYKSYICMGIEDKDPNTPNILIDYRLVKINKEENTAVYIALPTIDSQRMEAYEVTTGSEDIYIKDLFKDLIKYLKNYYSKEDILEVENLIQDKIKE